MCGRYTILHDIDAIAERFGVEPPTFDYGPRYNVAPTQGVPIVVNDSGQRRLTLAHWGLVPFWAKDPSMGSRLINARAETLAEKPAFKYALSRRRCLVPADGFYEWQRTPSGTQPFFVRRRDGELFAMAGLWETWESPDGSPLISSTIVTIEPNELLAPIHNRMPAMLLPEDEKAWLEDLRRSRIGGRGGDPPEAALVGLLRPYPADLLEAYPVSRYVSNPSHDGPLCIRPEGPRVGSEEAQ